MRIIAIVILFFLSSCVEKKKTVAPEVNWTQHHSTDLNKNLAIQEGIDIKLFLEMHKDWKMQETGSGLQYYIYEDGDIDTTFLPRKGNLAEIEFEATLLDGTVCDKTEEDEYQEFVVDNSEIESGLQEGIKKMSIGDRAKFIIPSHLGHGLIGNMDNIPPLTTLVIDVHLLGIK